MREILFRGKKEYDGEWIYGLLTIDDFMTTDGIERAYCIKEVPSNRGDSFNWVKVDSKTVGQYTGLNDKNDKKIFEGDIVQYNTYDDFDCHSIVEFGEYKQDGSAGEYGGRDCIGFYVKVNNFTCPDWCEDEPECFPYYMWQQNVLEVASKCEIIGNIYDNPELIV